MPMMDIKSSLMIYWSILLRRSLVQPSLAGQYRYASSRQTNRQKDRDHVTYDFASSNSKRAQRIYGFGFTLTGALGLKDFVIPSSKSRIRNEMHCVRRPVRLPFFAEERMHVGTIACGFGFSLFACKRPQKGWQLYGCGLNTDSQLGNQTRNYRGLVANANVELVLEPQFIPLTASSLQPDIVHVGCGRAHSVVACRGSEGGVQPVNRLFTLGNNAFGQCGRQIVEGEIYSDSQLVTEVVLPSELKDIKQVVCGQDHTLLLSSDGRVYSCGQSTDGQTGLGSYLNISQLSLVEGDIAGEEIVQMSSRGDTVLAVSSSGHLFGWGNSEYNQMGASAGNEMQLATPRHLPMPASAGKIVQSAAAGSACAALDSNGQVFVWGFGQLGLGPSVHTVSQPTQLPPPLFGHSEFSTQKIVVEDITCGLHHMAAKNSLGQVFTWGVERSGCLGLSTEKDQTYPLRVCIPGVTERVICGVDHTLVMARSFA